MFQLIGLQLVVLIMAICSLVCVLILSDSAREENDDDEPETDPNAGGFEENETPNKLPTSKKIAVLVPVFTLIFVLAVSPIFRVYNVGGVQENIFSEGTEELLSTGMTVGFKAQDASDIDELSMTSDKYHDLQDVVEIHPRFRNYFVIRVGNYIEEGATENNPKTITGLYTLPQLFVRICKNKDYPRPLQIKRIGIF